MAELPIIVLAFANEQEGRRYLRDLPEELRRLREILRGAEGNGLCKVELLPNATLDQIFDVFTRHRDKITILHFAGHADSGRLLLESSVAGSASVSAAGLATFLGQRQGLQLVFLNACSTRAQAARLLDAGVASVISTARAIDDGVATDFAAAFYVELASGAPLRAAYEAARGRVLAAHGDAPAQYYRSRELGEAPNDPASPDPTDDHGFPWEFRVGSELVERWSLPDAAGNPEFGLPRLPERDLPERPFRHLNWFTAEQAEVFFGRGYQIRELYEQVTDRAAPPILLLYGASGVGKSSLLDAGLLPRLESGDHAVRYCRRELQKGLAGSLVRAIRAEAETRHLHDVWRAEEARLAKPLVLFLDQVEEVFTRPDPAHPRELDEFVEALAVALGPRESRPRGKLVLGFRKEWLAEIDRRLAEATLPRSRVFLEQLDRRAIIEAIRGPARPGRMNRQYNITIEDGLPEVIAEDLLADAGSALAPTLQVLLTKMWERAREANPEQPRFERALYAYLKAVGYLLKDVLDEGLKAVGRWNPAVEESGLALDVLAYHATDLGTASQHTRSELYQRYAHQAEVLDGLLGRCKDSYLLIEAQTRPECPTGSTRLAHDLLAPLVLQRFRLSSAPGQRCRRLLENRAPEWHDGNTGPVLDGTDLATVEEGASGMRFWSADESRLVEASRLAQEQQRAQEQERTRRLQEAQERQRSAEADARREAERRLREQEESNQRLRKRAVALGTTLVLAVGVAFLAVLEWNRASVQKGIAEEKTAEADKATAKAKWQTQEAEKNLRIVNAERLVALSRSALLEKDTSLPNRPLAGVILAVEAIRATRDFNEPVVPSAATALQDALYYFQGRRVGKNLPKTVAMAVARDGRLVTAGDDGVVRVWDLKDRSAKQSAFRGHDSSIVNLAFAPDGRLVTVGADMTVRRWDFTNRSLAPTEFRGHTKRILTIAFAPSGRLATVAADETVRVWNLENPTSPPVIRRTGTLDPDLTQKLTFSADGRFLILADNKSSVYPNSLTLRIWSLEKDAEQPIMLIKSGSGGDLAVGLDGWLAAGGDDKTARVWNLKNPTARPIEFHGHEGGIHRLAFAPDGRLVSASSDKTVRVWEPKNPSARAVIFRGHTDEIKTIALAPNGRLLSIGEATMRMWDLGSPLAPPIVHYLTSDEYINVFAFAKDGRFVATSEGNSVRVWNLNNPSVESVVLRGNEQSIKDLVVTPDDYLVTLNDGKILRFWNLNRPSAQFQQIVLPDSEVISSIVFTPGDRLVSGGSNGISVRDLNNLTAPPLFQGVLTNANIFKVIAKDSHVVALDLPRVRVWKLNRRSDPGMILGDKTTDIAFAPDGRLVTGGDDGMVRVWDLENSFSQPTILSGHLGPVLALAFRPDGRLVTGGKDKSIRVWDLTDRLAPTTVLSGLEDSVARLAINSDGRFIVAADRKTVMVWDMDTPSIKPVPLRGHQFLYTIAISLDGRLVSGDDDGIIRVWDLKNLLARPIILRGHERPVSFLAFAADGRLVSASDERKVLVWDLKTPEVRPQPIDFRGHTSSLSALAMAPDGRIFTGSYDGTLRVWDIDVSRLIKLAEEVADRNLSPLEWERFFGSKGYRRTFPELPDG